MINNLKKIIKNKAFKNSIWLMILQFVNTIIPLFTIPYITRVLGAEQYGLFSIALNWILYFQVIVEFGFGLSGARKVAILKNQNDLNKLFNNILSSRILLCIITFILLNFISIISSLNRDTYICMLLLYLMVLGTTFQLTWLFQGKQDMKFITIINCISRIVSVLLIFMFIKNKSDVFLYCILYSITLFLSSIISIFVANKKYNLKFEFSKLDDIKNEIKDGTHLFYSSAMTKIFSGFGVTILGIFSSSYITGIYSAIYKVPYILTMIFSPISQAIYPYSSQKMTKSFSEGEKSIKKIAIPIFCVFAFIAIVIIVLRKFIIELLFGKEYMDYSIIIIPLIIQFLFAIVNNFLGIQTLVSSGHQKNYSKAFSIGCLFTIVLNILLGRYFKIYGVAYAAMIGEAILFASLLFQINKIRKENKYEKN